jgi:hypothetical protein
MKTVITAGLSEQESAEIKEAFVHAVHLRKRIASILQDKINASNKTVRSKDAYGIANWAYLQADAVGYERAMQEIINLLGTDGEAAARVADPRAASTTIPLEKPRRGRPRKIV